MLFVISHMSIVPSVEKIRISLLGCSHSVVKIVMIFIL
nr:MAG TPA: hypothetical protein [Caudoviricetes sp.]